MPRKGMTVRELLVVVVVIAAVAVAVYPFAQRAWQKRQERLDRELCDAARHRDTDEVRRLLLRGADVDAKDDRGKTPLRLAEERGHTSLAALLKQHGVEE